MGGADQIVDENGMTICFMSTPRNEANTELIASAPDLRRQLAAASIREARWREMLTEMLADYDLDEAGPGSVQSYTHAEKVRAALAAAPDEGVV